MTWQAATIVGASVAGSSHLRAGDGCQDAWAQQRHEDALLLAVADGMGSRAHAALGARTAADAAVGAPAEPEVMLERARAALETLAVDGPPLDELACTLLAIHASGDAIRLAHVGDGAIVGLDADGALHLLSAPERGEYVNETSPITGDAWQQAIRRSGPFDGLVAVAAFTDGCERAALTAEGTPHPGFWLPVLDHVRGAEPEAASAALDGLLAGAKMAEHSDDDKTLVIAWR